MAFAENLNALMRRQDASGAEIARIAGVSPSAVTRWRTGAQIRREPLERICEHFGLSPDDLLSDSVGLAAKERMNALGATPAPSVLVPVLGRISAGTGLQAIEQTGERHDTPASLVVGRPRAFWLRVSGSSMNRLLPDGALVLVDPDAEVRSGDIAAVFVNGDDATVKRVHFDGGAVILAPESHSDAYRERVIDEHDPDAPDVRMIGRVVSYTAPDRWRP